MIENLQGVEHFLNFSFLVTSAPHDGGPSQQPL
jgi:hypothetical protein